GRAGGLATGDEIAGGAQRLPAVEAQLVEQAVQALPQGLATLIQLGFSAGRLLRSLAGGVPGERVLGERLDLARGLVHRLFGGRRLGKAPRADQLAHAAPGNVGPLRQRAGLTVEVEAGGGVPPRLASRAPRPPVFS